MKLIQLTPYDLERVWDLFRFGLIQSVPGITNANAESMQAILVSLLNQKAQGWVLVDDEGITSIVITYIEHDKITGDKYLLCYAMYNFRPVGREGWDMLSVGLNKFARGNGCGRIVFYTNVPDLQKGAEIFGFKATSTVLERGVS